MLANIMTAYPTIERDVLYSLFSARLIMCTTNNPADYVVRGHTDAMDAISQMLPPHDSLALIKRVDALLVDLGVSVDNVTADRRIEK